MTTLLPTASALAEFAQGGAAIPDAKAFLEQQCRRVAGAPPATRRDRVLRFAALNLGNHPDVTLEAALSGLLAAARAGGYPEAIEGEELEAFIRRGLWDGRQQVPGWDSSRYGGWMRPQPKPPQVAAATASAADLAPDATPAAVATQAPVESIQEEPAEEESAVEEPAREEAEQAPAPAIAPKPLPVIAADAVPLVPGVDAKIAPPSQPQWDPILQRADARAPEPVEWLWKHRIALGRLTLIGGVPGCGKSTLAHSLIAAVTTGGKCPDGRVPLGSAILVCEEAAIRDSIMPGLIAAGADRSRVGLLGEVPGEGGDRPFNLRSDLDLLERAIKSRPDVSLVVIDPVNAFVAAADEREEKLGALLHPLAALAERCRVAVVVVAHPPKGNYLKPNVAALGSAALTAAARAAFLVQRDPVDPRRVFFVQIKNTLAHDRGAHAFAIERCEVAGVAGAVAAWEGRRYRLSAADLIGAQAKNNSAKAEAHAFLHNLMADVPSMPVKTLEAEARAAGLLGARQPLSQCRALRDARLALRLKVIREGFGEDGRWLWAKEEDPRENAETKAKKPKKTKKEKKAEWRARKVERRRAKNAEHYAAKAAARATTSMAETTSMGGTSSMATAPAPAVAQGQPGAKGSEE